MGEHHEMKKTTPQAFLMALLGGLFPALVAIVLIVIYVVTIQNRHVSAEAAAIHATEVEARIQPIGVSMAIDPNAPHVDRTGEQVYDDVCSNCHGSGALGSPKYKDKTAWGKRIAKGYDTLLGHALKGFNKMPPRGGEPELDDQEVANALVFMANAGGAKFKPILKKEPPPTAADLAKGKALYASNCHVCHDTGMTGAQKLNDTAAWEPLIKQGKDFLYNAAVNGTFAGPAKGGDPKLADADVKAAVDYMVEEAKAAIKAKKPAEKTAKD
jgi:cytochrome c5